MSYQAKTDWKPDDPVTEHDINRWEKGIRDANLLATENRTLLYGMNIRLTTLENSFANNFVNNQFVEDLTTLNDVIVTRGVYDAANGRLVI
ncbi:hypothetical protein [Metabacillus fastidiosus]|uniref:hypothetical protein n=1 Tax=Metabacillus fastidiosus TaxID=1458 RepID=UPI003D275667